MLPRMLRLHPSTYQRFVRLSKEAEKDGAYRVAKRLRAVLLNAEGYTSGELAELLQSPRSKVSEWLQRYQSSKTLAPFLLSIVKGHCPADIHGNPKARRNILFRATQAMKLEGPRRCSWHSLPLCRNPPTSWLNG